MGGKDDIEERIDISGFGFLKKVKDESVFEYTVDEPNKKMCIIAYMVLPGIEVGCTDCQTFEHFSGKVSRCDYYQIAKLRFLYANGILSRC